jgi:hypothetical protein
LTSLSPHSGFSFFTKFEFLLNHSKRKSFMSHRFLIYTAILLVFLFSVSAPAQEPAPAEGSDQRAAAATREKAIDLLSSVAGQVNTLRSAQNRARMGSTTAALLWEVDEPRARRLFSAVAEDIKLGFSEPIAEPEEGFYAYGGTQQPSAVFSQLRSNTVQRIAGHDPQFALEFLRATRPPVDDEAMSEVSESERALELQLAAQVAAKNPELALQLGRKALAEGFSYELLNVLTQLKSGNKGVWQGFYKEVIDKLKAANFVEDGWAEDLAIGLAQSFPPPQADEHLYRDLIGLIVADALAEGCGGGPTEDNNSTQVCHKIGSLFDKVQKYYPTRAAAFVRWAEQAAQGELWTQVYEAVEKGTIDEALTEAAKHPELADRIFWIAMIKAAAAGDFARARDIMQKTTNEELRESMLEHLKYVEMMNAEKSKQSSKSGDPGQVETTEERVRLLVDNAMRLAKTDRKTALEQLDQAGQIIESLKTGRFKLEGQVGLAIIYSSLQSDRGFYIVESLMPRLNELIAAGAALDGFETHYLTDGEWSMTGQGAIGGLTTMLAQNAGYFSRLDFDRSLNIVNQLERPEVRLMAQLMMAQGVLSDHNAGSMTLPRN